MSKNPDDYGQPCAGSRWFRGEPTVTERPFTTVDQRWICPIDECGGEMVFNGMTWPTGDPGYHHTCNKCKFTAAIHGGPFPRTIRKYLETASDRRMP